MNLVIRDIELSDFKYFKKFNCNNSSMDTFLKNEAYYHHIAGEGITKIVISEETGEIIAYYTLKCDSMKIEDSEMNPEPRQFPCIEVSRIVSAHTRAFFFSTYNNTRHYGRVCVDHETKKFTVLRQLNTMMYTHNERDPEVFKMIFEAVLAKLRKHHDISSYLVTGVLLKY